MSKLKLPESISQFGYENFDDCGIYKINKHQSIIQTVDFFTPIVDDPYTFGQIAAANSLSDIYAMGGKPIFALNIVAFPSESLSLDILSQILQGGQDKCTEAGINILGGHSIKDDIPKYGLAVTGIIENNKILLNNTPQNNDYILLTKPLGSGIITTAIKKNKCENKISEEVIRLMSTLNPDLTNINHKINACTDVTGYGLLGHLNEMCNKTNLTANINFKKIPFVNTVNDLANDGVVPGGTKNNLDYFQSNIDFDKNLKNHQKYMIADAQTSGGLLISVSKENVDETINYLNKKSIYKTKIIGQFIPKKNKNILVINE